MCIFFWVRVILKFFRMLYINVQLVIELLTKEAIWKLTCWRTPISNHILVMHVARCSEEIATWDGTGLPTHSALIQKLPENCGYPAKTSHTISNYTPKCCRLRKVMLSILAIKCWCRHKTRCKEIFGDKHLAFVNKDNLQNVMFRSTFVMIFNKSYLSSVQRHRTS